MNNRTLSWEEFCEHMEECEVAIGQPGNMPFLVDVAIRTGEGLDFGVAAIHREGTHLIIDMGHALEEIP